MTDPHKNQPTPPSFAPSSSKPRRHSVAASSENSATTSSSTTPPSFRPNNSSSRATSKKSQTAAEHRVSQSRLQPQQQQQPKPRTSRGSSNSNAIRPQSDNASLGSRMSTLWKENSRNNPITSSKGSSNSLRFGSTAARINGKKITKLIAVILGILLLIVAGTGTYLWFWVDNNLNHSTMLSSSSNTTGSTWLILGSDKRDGTDNTGTAADVSGFRTDTIMVLTKSSNETSSLISIPRDSYVEVNGTGLKINGVAELYGYDKLVSVVEGITGEHIDHVTEIGFSGVTKIVNALGGVRLCYDSTVNDSYSGLNWTAGCHTANGATALAFARMRYSDPTGDIGRAARQRQVISAIVKKLAKPSTFLNIKKIQKVSKAGFNSLTVDEDAGTLSMIQMLLAFRSASGSKGVTGSVYYTSTNYTPSSSVGSCVKLATQKNLDLFNSLSSGSISGRTTVGGLATED